MADEDRKVSDEEEEDDFDFYNPRTWLVSPAGSPETSLSAMMANLPLLTKPTAELEPLANLLPEKKPKFKVFIDEYRPDDTMQEIEHDFSNHIADAIDYAETASAAAAVVAAAVAAAPPSPLRILDIEGGGSSESASPLNDHYATKPYVVDAGQERTADEEEELAQRRLVLAREKLAKERGKYLLIGSELATVDPEVLLHAMLHPHEIEPPKPPLLVNALGKDGCASVWWQYDDFGKVAEEARVTAWEVTRYRRDGDSGWVSKGVTLVTEPSEIEKCRCEIHDVPNGVLYRFSVAGRNLRGKGFDSPLSDAVLVESDLPPGWFRFWDDASGHLYYSNLKTRQSSWERPEKDPFYLHEEIILAFSDAEHKHLRDIFQECIGLQGRITARAFKSILLEMGEVLGVHRIGEYFLEFGPGGRESIRHWDVYMRIMSVIKQRKVRSRETGSCQKCLNFSCCLPCFLWDHATCCTRFSFFMMLDNWDEGSTEKNKYGDWAIEYSELARKDCYVNSTTQERRWDAPNEVRFYLPAKLKAKLSSMFDPREVDEFKARFSTYDQDGSGNIDTVEFKLLLEGMGIFVSDRLRTRLINEIDLNRNGTIEFHEFCFLMMQLNNPQSGLAFLRKKTKLPSPEELRLAMSGAAAQPTTPAATQDHTPFGDGNQNNSSSNSKNNHNNNNNNNSSSSSSSSNKGGSALPPALCCASILAAYTQTVADYHLVVQQADEKVDMYLLCMRPYSEHGPTCMCGCRKVEEDDVYYCPFSVNEDEPIVWSMVCPCFDH